MKLRKLSDWRPDMPKRIVGFTKQELEVLREALFVYAGKAKESKSVLSLRRRVCDEIEKQEKKENE